MSDQPFDPEHPYTIPPAQFHRACAAGLMAQLPNPGVPERLVAPAGRAAMAHPVDPFRALDGGPDHVGGDV